MSELGVKGYLLKDSPIEEFELAVRAVAEGKSFYSAKIKDLMIDSLTKPKSTPAHLTRREKEVLNLICGEMSSPQIAKELSISVHTVDSHRKSLLNKLGVKNSVGLVKKAIEMGIYARP